MVRQWSYFAKTATSVKPTKNSLYVHTVQHVLLCRSRCIFLPATLTSSVHGLLRALELLIAYELFWCLQVRYVETNLYWRMSCIAQISSVGGDGGSNCRVTLTVFVLEVHVRKVSIVVTWNEEASVI